jgi:hypothetical protein
VRSANAWQCCCSTVAGGLLALAASTTSAFSQSASPNIPETSWAGPFVGGQLVGSLGTVATSEVTVATGTLFHHFDSLAAGGGGGANLGYNWLPWGNSWLVGVIADIDGLSDSGGHVFRTTDNITGTAGVRAGLLTSPDLVWYGQTGVAVTDEKIKVNFGGPITSGSRTAAGYALGTGAEWALPAAPLPLSLTTASLFIDYQHVWWDGGSVHMPAAVPTLNFRWQRDGNALKAGLRLHF